jgi:hypothetical protein
MIYFITALIVWALLTFFSKVILRMLLTKHNVEIAEVISPKGKRVKTLYRVLA